MASKEAQVVDALRDALKSLDPAFTVVVGLLDLLAAPDRTVMLAAEKLAHDDSGVAFRRWTLTVLVVLRCTSQSDSGDGHADTAVLDETRVLLDAIDAAANLKPAALGVERLTRGAVEYFGPPLSHPGGVRLAAFEVLAQWKSS